MVQVLAAYAKLTLNTDDRVVCAKHHPTLLLAAILTHLIRAC